MDVGLAGDLAWMLHELNETVNEYDGFEVGLTHPGLARLASVSTARSTAATSLLCLGTLSS